MSQKQITDQMDKEAKRLSTELTKELTKKLNAKDVLAKVDAASSGAAKGKTPPLDAQKAFGAALNAVIKAAQSKTKGVKLQSNVTYKLKNKKWRAEGAIVATILTKKISAKSVKIKAGDTLFKLAESHYGDGNYYPLIADANPKQVKHGGNFIAAHSTLTFPSLTIPDPSAKHVFSPSLRVAGLSKISNAPAKELGYPDLFVDLTGSETKSFNLNTGKCAVKITVKLKGTITVRKNAVIKAKVDEKGLKAEAAAMLSKNLKLSCEMAPGTGVTTVSTGLTGPLGSAAVKVDRKLNATASITAKLFTREIAGYKVTSKIGADLTFNFRCGPSEMPEPVQERWAPREVYDALILRSVIATGVVVVGVGAIVLAPEALFILLVAAAI